MRYDICLLDAKQHWHHSSAQTPPWNKHHSKVHVVQMGHCVLVQIPSLRGKENKSSCCHPPPWSSDQEDKPGCEIYKACSFMVITDVYEQRKRCVDKLACAAGDVLMDQTDTWCSCCLLVIYLDVKQCTFLGFMTLLAYLNVHKITTREDVELC